MSQAGRLIVVSNRLPVAVKREGASWEVTRTAGGLATAMDPILRQRGGVWIGWSGADEALSEDALKKFREQSCIAVDLPPDIAVKFYEGYSNGALWPLFHSFTGRFRFEADTWDAYIDANRRFAEAVIEQYKPGDRIWIHDYHLMLVPEMLREKLPDAAVGFFLHIPFPASDIFSLLPRGHELLSGLLGSDLIAFHTHQHLQHFRRALRRLLGVESKVDVVELPGRTARLQALPIGIAPAEFIDLLAEPDTQDHLSRLRSQYDGQQFVVAVDRLDYTKGIPERLRTFRRLLRTRPELSEKVVLLQVAVPSRENIESYQDLTSEVNQLVSEINGKFGTASWVPVVYINRGITRAELVALYSFADVAWVSPLRDGMNLVAKEYVACKPDGNGVLVLSSFAGAAAEMGEALLINPYDEEQTASALMRALTLDPSERRDRMSALHDRVLRNNVFTWGDRFLQELDAATERRSEGHSGVPPLLDMEAMLRNYDASNRRLLLLDYDGTLVGFQQRPQDAVPDSALRNWLRNLAADPKNTIYVVSGRTASDIERWFGDIANLGLAAEHGVRSRAGGASEWQSRSLAAEWKPRVRPILDHFVDRTPGSFVEEKAYALVWHYRSAEPEFGEWLATELVSMLEGMLADTELRPYRGNRIVEVKPGWANKGEFARAALAREDSFDFVLAIGDDRTDEDLFAPLSSDSWSVHVGDSPSMARFRLHDVRHVHELLARIQAATPQAK
jgi:trehalose 6-phosphate synthase/phosphatase